jgi:hypothetical protein
VLVILTFTLLHSAYAQTIRGTVLDDSTSLPIATAEITILDTLGTIISQAISDSAGQFRFAVSPGDYAFRVLRIGYAPTVTTVLHAPNDADDVTVVIRVPSASALEAGDPYALTPVVVEAQPVQRFLATYHRHEALGMGDHLLREEFAQWNPQQVTDVVRRMRGFSILPNPNYGRPLPDGLVDMREYLIDVPGRPHHRTSALTECPPLIFLDGASLGNSQTVDINSLPLNAISAVEAYGRSLETPVEYMRASNDCGVIALWTRSGEPGQVSSPFELGVRFGGLVAGGAFVGGRLGIHLVTQFVGPLEFYPALYLVSSVLSSDQTPENSSWMAQVAVRATVLQSPFPLYVGSGLVLVKPDASYRAVLDEVDIDPGYSIFTGLRHEMGVARPFVELHLLDFLAPSSTSAQAFLGIGFRF